MKSGAVVALAVVAGLVEMALLIAWQRNGYWDFSNGVYAASAHEFLHGLVPYRDFAAAQPPPVLLVGALLLAIEDGAEALHIGLGLVDLATAALVGLCVWRLTRRLWPALLAAAIAPLLPISLHEHAQLTPETLAAPLLLAAAILLARAQRSVLGGALLALAVWCKFAFALPALAIVLAAAAPRRALAALTAGCLLLGGLWFAAFGTGLWQDAVQAQLQVGTASVHSALGLLAQATWNEVPLVIAAAAFGYLAWVERDQLREPALIRTLAAAAVGGLLLGATVFKRGSYINVLAVAEPPLMVLAVCGALSWWQRRRTWRPLVLGIGALLVAQSLSLLISPSDPWVAKRPLAGSGLNWSAGPSAVQRAVSAARRCPSTLAYSGNPWVAFLASRRMPGRQPDLFMLANARADTGFAQRAARDRPQCP